MGCGALGSLQADMLARAGVGRLRLIDRDEIERSNLQRQFLYTEDDLQNGLPKAEAAARHLARVNPEVAIEPLVADLVPGNAEKCLAGADVILDGTDNFETRQLINEYCVKSDVPWIYGGVVGSEGTVLGIVPGRTPCLACLFGEAPPPGAMPTCDTAGVISPAVAVVAGLQVAEALKILSGQPELLKGTLWAVDVWTGRARTLDLSAARDDECDVCVQHRFDVLESGQQQRTTALCGRGTVQVSPPTGTPPIDLIALERKLSAVGHVRRNPFLLRARIGEHRLTVFSDGRILVKGTDDPAEARSVCARYIGT